MIRKRKKRIRSGRDSKDKSKLLHSKGRAIKQKIKFGDAPPLIPLRLPQERMRPGRMETNMNFSLDEDSERVYGEEALRKMFEGESKTRVNKMKRAGSICIGELERSSMDCSERIWSMNQCDLFKRARV